MSRQDNAQFDRALLQRVGDIPPPPGTAATITPWYRAITYLLWGLALTTITLPILIYVLPFVGSILLCHGLRILREENQWFHRGLKLGYAYAGWYTVMSLLWATPLTSLDGWPLPLLNTLLILARYLLLLVLCIQLRRALKQTLCQQEINQKRDPLLWLVVFYVVYLSFSMWISIAFPDGVSTVATPVITVCTLSFVIVFFCILRRIWSAAMLFEGDGYLVKAAPVRLSEHKLGLLWLGCTAVLALLLNLFCTSFPISKTPVVEGGDAAYPELRRTLIGMGFRSDILDDLSPEELLRYEGAHSVQMVQTQTGELGGSLQLTTVTVLLDDSRARILSHFCWTTPPSFRGMDGVELLLPQSSIAASIYTNPSGRLLWETGDTTWESPLHTLEQHSVNGTYQALFGEFSLPRGGENCRGYVGYEILLAHPGLETYFNTDFRYVYQSSPLNYPWSSPTDWLIKGGSVTYRQTIAATEAHLVFPKHN